MTTLTGKIALITGGSSGIGAEIARCFAAEGATVIITSNTSIDTGSALAAELVSAGYQASYLQADLGDEASVAALFRQVGEIFGRLDILINNAGRTYKIPFQELTQDSLRTDLDVNLISSMLCAKYAAPLMEEGWIVNTTSIRGMTDGGRPGIMGYCAAKAGVISFTKNLALELAPKVCVNAIAPGFVYTDYFAREMPKDLQEQWLTNIPMGEFVDAKELANAYRFLCTTRALTGTVIPVDGGYTILNR